ncbi:ABC transporter permease subunit [Paenibacillus sp. D2_2]|uniref:ABC transporter permease subunit n=1 Tax=Paenibacillus sp. D2_2 TaxID=3073092 RepID=UPI0028156D0D|nr:ABC transporter permease subunit [Paenibacillus sp. D2_2]WMT41778.1 ABC transporter permease subunit [Paenibacillus sp. D2_2]
MSKKAGTLGKTKLIDIGKSLRQQKYLQLMVIPGLIWLFIFCYIPMAGLFAAFFEYNPFLGILKSPFVGFAHFKELFQDELFWKSVRNMFGLSLTKTGFAIVMPILFALMLNEIKNVTLKKIVQTASYLPHFISWVVVAGLFIMWLSTDGIVNHVLMSFGIIYEPQSHLNSPGGFWLWMAIIDTWKETGWWAIIYLAAIAAIPVEQYESAVVDGASRIRRIISITIPSIKPTIMIVVILSIGSMIYGGFPDPICSNLYSLGIRSIMIIR